MSVRSDRAKPEENTASLEAAVADTSLAEGNSYSVATPDNPLKRSLVVSIRASLNQLCLQKQKGVWSPSTDALKSICKQPELTRTPVAHVTNPYTDHAAARLRSPTEKVHVPLWRRRRPGRPEGMHIA